MVGLDTNILVRFLTQDDPKQCVMVNKLMQEFEEKNQNLWISLVVVCELVWVLESCYDQTKAEVNSALMQLLQVQQLKIDHAEVIQEALRDYLKHKKIDFSDCLIAHCNKAENCEYTLTFDQVAAKLESVKLLKM